MLTTFLHKNCWCSPSTWDGAVFQHLQTLCLQLLICILRSFVDLLFIHSGLLRIKSLLLASLIRLLFESLAYLVQFFPSRLEVGNSLLLPLQKLLEAFLLFSNLPHQILGNAVYMKMALHISNSKFLVCLQVTMFEKYH